jgi:hypothetical protein
MAERGITDSETWITGSCSANGQQLPFENGSKRKSCKLRKRWSGFPPDVKKFLHESLHLPKSFHDETSFTIGEGKIKLLGSSQTRVLNLDEEIAFLNFLKIGAEEIDRLTVQAFPRLEMQSTKSIFTTSKYTLSSKRSNNCALLTNGMFFLY